MWSRPTLEVNGMTSGYTGKGFKTVLPAQASAKISCRLVKGQDPHAIGEALEAFVKERLPADCEAVFHPHGASTGIELDITGPAFQACLQALTDEWPKPAAFTGIGGSIPIVGQFQSGSASTAFWSASVWRTIRFTRPTKSTSWKATARASAPGCASCMPWRTHNEGGLRFLRVEPRQPPRLCRGG
jgi:hypothetical protein